MSFALSAEVTKLQTHQNMLDVAGNNLANANTTAFKSSRITFAELLSETIKKASQPTATVSSTNPQRMGSGVAIVGIAPNMGQGNIVNTGNPLDLAIEGEGYFVLSDGEQEIYTRSGTFAVDANLSLVDPATGYIVQRIGSVGESDGFQTAGNSDVHVPYDVAMPAKATTEVTVSGNLSADATLSRPQTNKLTSNIVYTTNNGITATGNTDIDDLDQFSGSFVGTGTLSISGFNHDGTGLTVGSTLSVDADTDLDAAVSYINTILSAAANQNADGSNETASLSNGRIVITDGSRGYSKSDVELAYVPSGGGESLKMPVYFEISTIGGEEIKNINITVYDSQGSAHVLTGAFVRTDTADTWDMIMTSITGDVSCIDMDDRRIEGIKFDAGGGSYSGLNTTTESSEFVVTFGHDPSSPQTIAVLMGTVGEFDGLTQFAGNSTAVAREQDGYEAGRLSSVSVNNEGIVIGAFSNGIKKNIAALQVALFQNTAGLESVGNGYCIPSANSGMAVATQALTDGAGSIHGGALEKSNADVANEFVTMIQAQNGFQANAQTITVANDILRELTNFIR
ncbi:MAG: flagellar hook protein FlgE [Planctomycetota bacterium]|jgi:flagellar hook protein FlgE